MPPREPRAFVEIWVFDPQAIVDEEPTGGGVRYPTTSGYETKTENLAGVFTWAHRDPTSHHTFFEPSAERLLTNLLLAAAPDSPVDPGRPRRSAVALRVGQAVRERVPRTGLPAAGQRPERHVVSAVVRLRLEPATVMCGAPPF